MDGRATQARSSHLYVRRCVACGYESQILDDVLTCTHCGCDLLTRPPRSYAEMEGLMEVAPAPHAVMSRWQPPDLSREMAESETTRTIKRWMLFFMLTLLLMISIAALGTAALGG